MHGKWDKDAKVTDMDVNSTMTRAMASGGKSYPAVYRKVSQALREFEIRAGTLLDLGCGRGFLWRYVSDLFSNYIGVDLIRYEDFPESAALIVSNLNSGQVPLAAGCADVVTAIETIEYLENPSGFMRELTRLAKPGGTIVVSTKNHLSLLSKVNLLIKNRFVALKDRADYYPTSMNALLEINLVRMAHECRLTDLRVIYTNDGRIPFSALRWPGLLGLRGRHFSDNVLLVGRKPPDVTTVHSPNDEQSGIDGPI